MLIRTISHFKNSKSFHALKQAAIIHFTNHKSLASQPQKQFNDDEDSILPEDDNIEEMEDKQSKKLNEFQDFLHGFGDDKKDPNRISCINLIKFQKVKKIKQQLKNMLIPYLKISQEVIYWMLWRYQKTIQIMRGGRRQRRKK